MKEADIRPSDLTAEYLRLSALDAEQFFPKSDRVPTDCVACQTSLTRSAFTKSGFDYRHCPECGTLFLSPRPPLSQFAGFYRDSPSSRFWAETFFPALMQNRRELIFAPRARRISQLCLENGLAPGAVIDVGAGYGIFLEEWRKLHPKTWIGAVEPGEKLAAICREKGIEVLETVSEEASAWAERADLVVCFEVIEHAHDPAAFVRSLWKLVRPGGYALISGLGVDGFDIQVLWEESNSVSPPHHINLISVRGFEQLFERVGFDRVAVSTPGLLDVDIVRNAGNALADEQRFARLLLSRGTDAAAEFQAFLARHRLSSHTWILARRPPRA